MMKVEKSLVSLLMGAVLLGMSPILVRLSEVGALATGFWRFAVALPVLILFYYFSPTYNTTKQPTATFRDYITLIAAGVVLGVDIAFCHLSLDYTTVAISTILIHTAPLLLALWYWILGSRPSFKFLKGLGCTLLGILLLVQPRFQIEREALYGILLALSGAGFYALYISMTNRIRQKFSTVSTMLFSTLGAFLCMSLILVTSHEPWLPTTWSGCLVILGLASGMQILAQGLILYAFARIPVIHSAALLLIQPLTATLLGFWLFEEHVNLLQILGIATAFSGLYVVSQARGNE